MIRVKLTLEYNGARFHGWQTQTRRADEDDPEVGEETEATFAATTFRTVQSVLETALASLYQQPLVALGAARTDTGVHALGQVASILIPEDRGPAAHQLADALNTRLPEDLAVLNAASMPMEFHPIRDARGKRYRYTIVNRRSPSPLRGDQAWHVSYKLNDDAMRAAAAFLLGRHDFAPLAANLRNIQKARLAAGKKPLSTLRELRRLDITRQGMLVHFDAECDGFLYRMVRIITGSLMEVGRGRFPPEWLADVLAGQAERGSTAPPHGLTLMDVLY